MTPKPLLEIGYVARAHGIAGELGIRTFDPASEALFEAEHLTLVSRAGQEKVFVIEDAREATKEVLVALEGIDSRTDAEGWVGAKVAVARDELSPPEEGEVFQGDLVGLLAVDEGGQELGRVEEVWNTGPVPNLVIRRAGRELIVPFADPFVPKVELEAGRVVVRPPELIE